MQNEEGGDLKWRLPPPLEVCCDPGPSPMACDGYADVNYYVLRLLLAANKQTRTPR
jgi:hypothetical protein